MQDPSIRSSQTEERVTFIHGRIHLPSGQLPVRQSVILIGSEPYIREIRIRQVPHFPQGAKAVAARLIAYQKLVYLYDVPPISSMVQARKDKVAPRKKVSRLFFMCLVKDRSSRIVGPSNPPSPETPKVP